MNPVKTEVDDVVDSLKEEYQSKLYQVKQRLLLDLEKVDAAINYLNKEPLASINENRVDENIPSIDVSDLTKLQEATWAELFLWGLARCDNEASISAIAKELSQLPIENIQQRVAKKTLYQVLDFQAKVLHKREHKIEKVKINKGKEDFSID